MVWRFLTVCGGEFAVWIACERREEAINDEVLVVFCDLDQGYREGLLGSPTLIGLDSTLVDANGHQA